MRWLRSPDIFSFNNRNLVSHKSDIWSWCLFVSSSLPYARVLNKQLCFLPAVIFLDIWGGVWQRHSCQPLTWNSNWYDWIYEYSAATFTKHFKIMGSVCKCLEQPLSIIRTKGIFVVPLEMIRSSPRNKDQTKTIFVN